MISNGGQVVIMLCDDESNAWTIGGDKNGLGVHGVVKRIAQHGGEPRRLRRRWPRSRRTARAQCAGQ